MKKSLLSLGTVIALAGMIAFNTGCGVTKGCTESQDDNYNAAATEDDGSCDEDATSGKFSRNNVTLNINGSASNGTYVASIQQGANDYEIVLTTNFGLSGGVSPVNFTCTVDQNVATFSSTNIAQGTASGTVTYAAGTGKVTITVTLAGFGGGIDGTTADTEQ